MNPEQRKRFECHAVLEAHAGLLVRLLQAGAVDDYLGQIERIQEAAQALLALPRPTQKAA